mgnify:CR=1 FL=1
MTEVGRTYGARIALGLWLIVGVWLIGLVLAPLATLAGRSLSTVEPAVMTQTLEIDRLQDEIAAMRWDWERSVDAERRADLDRRVRMLTDRALRLAAETREPPTVWGLANYARLGGLHARVLLHTLGFALVVTFVTFGACYPIAHGLAFATRPRRAALLAAALVVPYALNQILRTHAWAEILATLGLAAPSRGGPAEADPRAVLVAMVHASVLFMVLPIWSALASLDRRLIEAARDLGASPLRIHARIVLPHAGRGIAIGAAATFVLAAGSHAVPRIMTGGQGGDWFALLVWRRVFEAADWNVGAAYATTLFLACLLAVFALMRLFGVRFADLVRRGGRHA